MHLSLTALILASAASAANAEDVTVFLAGTGTRASIDINDAVASISFLGASPVSVDEAGATYYAFSRIVSDIPRIGTTEGEVITETNTFQADATRVVQAHTTTLAELGGVVWETKFECVHLDDGTSVCQNRLVEKAESRTVTQFDTTYTGTPSPWVTIKGVDAAISTDDDKGGVAQAWSRVSLIGSVFVSLAVGVALV
ncbi:hypothetical protein BKA70DRAFT_1559312 [Coprinopsis sp. MPI-PUGE-AT-0042]|nr:hypothetical protein BKA70DRAFT_1559312 [Coprinopsis sp. MPI-PUGE-AT-0042]